MKKHIIVCLLLVFGLQLGLSQTKAERKAAKKEQEAKTYAAMKTLVESKHFTFEADWATTQSGKRINLIGNPNFLEIDNTQTKADMPYFGVAQIASYGGDGGIKFEGPYKNFSIEYNDKKGLSIIKYEISNSTESFNVTLRVFGPESASVMVYSSNRNSITYDGNIKPIEATKEE